MRARTGGWLWDPAPAEDGPLQMPELWREGTIVPSGQRMRTKGEARGRRTAGWRWGQAAAQTVPVRQAGTCRSSTSHSARATGEGGQCPRSPGPEGRPP